MTRKVIAPVLILLALSGCASRNLSMYEVGGAAAGAALGGWAGSHIGTGTGQMIYMGIGSLLGAVGGYAAGVRLEQSDLTLYGQTVEKGLAEASDGTTLTWKNPETGNSGAFRPTQTFYANSGALCRNYRATVAYDGGVQSADGAACRRSDGTWQIVTDNFS